MAEMRGGVAKGQTLIRAATNRRLQRATIAYGLEGTRHIEEEKRIKNKQEIIRNYLETAAVATSFEKTRQLACELESSYWSLSNICEFSVFGMSMM